MGAADCLSDPEEGELAEDLAHLHPQPALAPISNTPSTHKDPVHRNSGSSNPSNSIPLALDLPTMSSATPSKALSNHNHNLPLPQVINGITRPIDNHYRSRPRPHPHTRPRSPVHQHSSRPSPNEQPARLNHHSHPPTVSQSSASRNPYASHSLNRPVPHRERTGQEHSHTRSRSPLANYPSILDSPRPSTPLKQPSHPKSSFRSPPPDHPLTMSHPRPSPSIHSSSHSRSPPPPRLLLASKTPSHLHPPRSPDRPRPSPHPTMPRSPVSDRPRPRSRPPSPSVSPTRLESPRKRLRPSSPSPDTPNLPSGPPGPQATASKPSEPPPFQSHLSPLVLPSSSHVASASSRQFQNYQPSFFFHRPLDSSYPTHDNRAPLCESRSTKKVFVGVSQIGAYELVEKLGEGTFGEVFKGIYRGRAYARQQQLEQRMGAGANASADPEESSSDEDDERGAAVAQNRVQPGMVVALKRIIVHNELDGLPITALREIRILKSLSHPNVVPVVDLAFSKGNRAGLRRGNTYMVFPYLDHDLAGLMENKAITFSVSQIKLYSKQLLLGTAYLHRNKILHRDLKAANLLISNTGQLKIADFGLARSIEEQHNTRRREYTNCVVTRWYRPPEILLGNRRYGTPVDMWGVGCVIGEMFKGGPILTGSSDVNQCELIFRLCGSPTTESMPGWEKLPGCEGVRAWQSKPRRVREEYERISPELADLLDHLLLLDPSKRLTAEEALDHDWFWTDPMAIDPAKLPHYEPSHEYDRRKKDEQTKKSQQLQLASFSGVSSAAPPPVPLTHPTVPPAALVPPYSHVHQKPAPVPFSTDAPPPFPAHVHPPHAGPPAMAYGPPGPGRGGPTVHHHPYHPLPHMMSGAPEPRPQSVGRPMGRGGDQRGGASGMAGYTMGPGGVAMGGPMGVAAYNQAPSLPPRPMVGLESNGMAGTTGPKRREMGGGAYGPPPALHGHAESYLGGGLGNVPDRGRGREYKGANGYTHPPPPVTNGYGGTAPGPYGGPGGGGTGAQTHRPRHDRWVPEGGRGGHHHHHHHHGRDRRQGQGWEQGRRNHGYRGGPRGAGGSEGAEGGQWGSGGYGGGGNGYGGNPGLSNGYHDAAGAGQGGPGGGFGGNGAADAGHLGGPPGGGQARGGAGGGEPRLEY